MGADRILSDGDLRRSLIDAGTERVADFELKRTTARLVEFLSPLIDGEFGS